ncbi:MAG TPA: carbon storage regulator [Pirellulales bacterium]|nr:carbon storage regulator [Pirellulales bacterium]
MLVLTRKTQQQVQIGDNIRITILQIKGSSVRIGIEAPREVRIARTELVPLTEQPVAIEPTASLPVRDRVNEPARRDAGSKLEFSTLLNPDRPHLAGALGGGCRIEHAFIAAHAAAEAPEWPERNDLANETVTAALPIERRKVGSLAGSRRPRQS